MSQLHIYCHENVHLSVYNSTPTEVTRKGRKKPLQIPIPNTLGGFSIVRNPFDISGTYYRKKYVHFSTFNTAPTEVTRKKISTLRFPTP